MERFTLVETPIRESFADEVRAGLSRRPRTLPPCYFYDARGTELFERICDLPEYYLARTEREILESHAEEIPAAETVIEFGCGHAKKTRLVFDALFRRRDVVTYVPVDISKDALRTTSRELLDAYPGLTVRAINAEYGRALDLIPHEPSLVLFLGSNVGNLEPDEAASFLSALRGNRMLVGFDLQKDPALLHAAYNDAEGVTAEFNLNILRRINRELGGDFKLDAFEHRALYNITESRVEMHLVAKASQQVRIRDLRLTLELGARDGIHTENSYKYTADQIRRLAARGGFSVGRVWTDDRRWFSAALLES